MNSSDFQLHVVQQLENIREDLGGLKVQAGIAGGVMGFLSGTVPHLLGLIAQFLHIKH